MRKNSIVSDSLLWILILVAVLMPIRASSASVPPEMGAAIFGSRFNLSANETAAESAIAAYIRAAFAGQNYDARNWYGGYTTVSTVLAAAQGLGYNYDTLFHIGHGGYWNWYWLIGYTVHYYYLDDSGEWVKDCDVYAQTTSGCYYFVFIWSCYQGDVIGGDDSHTAAVGMPYAWLHTNALSSDGYATPDSGSRCFIGFKHFAPQLTNDFLGNGAMSNFLQSFYSNAVTSHFIINTSLDNAALHVWG